MAPVVQQFAVVTICKGKTEIRFSRPDRFGGTRDTTEIIDSNRVQLSTSLPPHPLTSVVYFQRVHMLASNVVSEERAQI